MNVVEELEEVLTHDQAQGLADFDSGAAIRGGSSTQQLLDELLGRFEEDDSPMLLAHGLTPEFYTDSDD
ncbi:MAG TPA: hypothetical protein VN948_17150 [Terriglobales bacterium]|nr:hypothetical protein [Terriglobales bacterium]